MALLSGSWGPAINEKDQFANSVIEATDPRPWIVGSQHLVGQIPSVGIHKKLKTTAYLIIKNGKLIKENYALAEGIGELSNSFSIAKSIVAIAIGNCILENKISLPDKVIGYVPILDASLSEVTIEHLLSMATGIHWDESSTPTSDNAEAYYGSDIQKMFFSLRAKESPGRVFEYVSIATQLLAACIESATDFRVDQWVSKNLWPNIGAEYDAFWNLDHPGGRVKAFCCFYATARDFARIGQLCLNDGSWNGVQIVEPSFLEKCTTPTNTFDRMTKTPNACYGWHWWIVNHRGYSFFYARGIRGQYIICCRELELVIVRLGHLREHVDSATGHPPDLLSWIDEGLNA